MFQDRMYFNRTDVIVKMAYCKSLILINFAKIQSKTRIRQPAIDLIFAVSLLLNQFMIAILKLKCVDITVF